MRHPARGPHHICARPLRTSSPLLQNLIFGTDIWCASGSGVLARGLAAAWANARRHVVQVGRSLTAGDVAGATIHVYPLPYGREARTKPPFPSDPHYDAKAWEQCTARKSQGRVLFWNVAGSAEPYLYAAYGFGETRVATLALLTFTVLSGRRSCGVIMTKFSGHAVTFRSSPTVFADTRMPRSTSTRILSGKPPRAMWSAATLLGLYRMRALPRGPVAAAECRA